MWNQVSFDPRSYERSLYNYIYRSLKNSGPISFPGSTLVSRWRLRAEKTLAHTVIPPTKFCHVTHNRISFSLHLIYVHNCAHQSFNTWFEYCSVTQSLPPQKISVFDISDMFPFLLFSTAAFLVSSFYSCVLNTFCQIVRTDVWRIHAGRFANVSVRQRPVHWFWSRFANVQKF